MHTIQNAIIYGQKNQAELGIKLYYCMGHLMIGLETSVQQSGLQYYEGFCGYIGFPTTCRIRFKPPADMITSTKKSTILSIFKG